MKTCYTYKAFGLTIQSEFECPELMESSDIPEVYIKLGVVPKSLDNPLFSGVRFQTNGQAFLLTVDQIARYYVQEGKSVTIEKYPDANINEVRLFLLGSAFGALIHQRGLIPFHGSSLKIGDSAIILSGVSGAGKSTLAAAFRQKGYPLLSDDVSVISFSPEGVPLVHPGYPQMKLWPDSIRKLGEDPSIYSKIRAQLEKHSIPARDCFWEQPLPLGKIFIIVASNFGKVKVEPVRGIEKFSLLKAHTYRFNFVAGKQMQTSHFRSFERLAKNIKVFTLIRPTEKFAFNDLIDEILEHCD